MPKKGVALAIDGGGIRGIIPAVILVELEARLKKAGKNKPLSSYFHLISGTSTGGIIAAGLTAPNPTNKSLPALSPADLLNLYKQHGKSIFSRDTFRRVREALTDWKSISQEKYDASELESLLQERFGMAKLSEALTGVMLTAYNITQRETVFMKNPDPASGRKYDDYLFWQAARGTSAAPTFFEPARIKNFTKNRIETLIDGGVFNNNPALSAYIEMLKLGYAPQDITIVSLGTGYQNRPIEFRDAKNWGPINWINPSNGVPILSIMMHGQVNSTEHHLENLLNSPANGPQKGYYRFDAELFYGSDDMDDASETNIRALEQLGQEIIHNTSANINAIVDIL